MMIIDCHGHYTTAPDPHKHFRDAQLARLKDSSRPVRPRPPDHRRPNPRNHRSQSAQAAPRSAAPTHALLPARIGDGASYRRRGDLAPMDARLQRPHQARRRALSRTISPASANCRNRPAFRFPTRSRNSSGACASSALSAAISTRIRPAAIGPRRRSPIRTGDPFYEKMVELDVPAMVHVSSSCNPNFHATGAHYINADTTAFMQFIEGDLFRDFPDAALHHPAWRRRRPLSLGTLSRPGRHAEATAARRACHEERVLRHLRLSPARHRPSVRGHRRRQHPVRVGNGRRRARRRSGDGVLFRRHQALHRCALAFGRAPPQGVRSSMRAASTRGSTRRSRRKASDDGSAPAFPMDAGLASVSPKPVQAGLHAAGRRCRRALPRVRSRRTSFPTRRSANTRRATRRRKSSGHCATSWASSATSSSRPPATALTIARWSMRCGRSGKSRPRRRDRDAIGDRRRAARRFTRGRARRALQFRSSPSRRASAR